MKSKGVLEKEEDVWIRVLRNMLHSRIWRKCIIGSTGEL